MHTHADARPRPHTHTHTHIHKHSDYTKLNLQFEMGSKQRLEIDEDSSRAYWVIPDPVCGILSSVDHPENTSLAWCAISVSV